MTRAEVCGVLAATPDIRANPREAEQVRLIKSVGFRLMTSVSVTHIGAATTTGSGNVFDGRVQCIHEYIQIRFVHVDMRRHTQTFQLANAPVFNMNGE